jgi:hypothetical protein
MSPTLWKIVCQEDDHPGLWRQWFKHQCVAVGWPPQRCFRLHGGTKGGRGWARARKALQDFKVGDVMLVALRGRRVGRLGWVTGKAIEDSHWKPLVEPSSTWPYGLNWLNLH